MSDIEFITEENEEQNEEEQYTAKKRPVKNKKIPAEYIPVKLSSLGKLDAPNTLHVRDYSGADILNLASANDMDSFLRKLIEVANNIVYEGFDCGYLHEYELEEIMLNVMSNFWTPIISDYPYPYTDEEYELLDEERKERVEKGLENLVIDIPISSIPTAPIVEEFKEPITIKKNNLTIAFRLPRIRDYFIAQEYIEEKYASEYQKFSHIENINKIEDDEVRKQEFNKLSKEETDDYNQFNSNRGIDYIKAKQAQLLEKVGSKKLPSLSEKIEEFEKGISIQYWKKYNSLLEDYLSFGVNHNIEVTSPITQEKVIRRCQFRPMDLIPSNELPNDGEYDVLFG